MSKDSKQSQLKNIPNHWSKSTVENEASICTGNKDTQDKIDDGTYPFFVRSNTIERINSYSFDGEAVLTSGDGVGVGKIYHYLNCKFDYHQRVYNIHNFSNNLLGRYFYYYFSMHFYNRVMRLSAKNSVDSVRRDMIADMEIPLPPLPEQQKIAEILSTVDDKIDIIDQQICANQELKKGLMQQLLSKGIGHTEFKDSPLGEIPKSWEVVKIGELNEDNTIIGIQDGNHGEIHPVTTDFVNEGIPFIMANCITKANRLNLSNAKRISISQYNSLRIGFAMQGDVLLTHKGTVGLTALVLKEHGKLMLTPQVTYYRVNENGKLDRSFLYYFFQSTNFQKLLEKFAKQSTRAYIGITAQKKLPILLPFKKDEQQKIASILTSVDDKLKALSNKKEHFQQLKKGLMQQLLTGKIRVVV